MRQPLRKIKKVAGYRVMAATMVQHQRGEHRLVRQCGQEGDHERDTDHGKAGRHGAAGAFTGSALRTVTAKISEATVTMTVTVLHGKTILLAAGLNRREFRPVYVAGRAA
jgi:hypothetical protein